MGKNTVLVFLMMLLVSAFAFSKQFERGYEYYIVNNSSENIKLTFRSNNKFNGEYDSGRLFQDFNIGMTC